MRQANCLAVFDCRCGAEGLQATVPRHKTGEHTLPNMPLDYQASQRRWISPLRYPGGKGRMAGYLGDIFVQQAGQMDIEIWVEPFAGGAGAGLTLLDSGIVSELWLTELHPPLAAFWRAVCHQGDELAARIAVSAATLRTWEESQAVLAAHQRGQQFADLDLGFAAFFVNRCARSGIMAPNVGPIGGKHQSGRWTIGSRYNAPALAQRILHVHSLASRIRITEGDALRAIADLASSGIEDEIVLLVDPPYLVEGNRLYTNGLGEEEHQELARILASCPSRWMLTYDDQSVVAQDLYPNHRILSYSIPHTANRQRTAREYAVFSDDLWIDPDAVPLNRGTAHWLPDSPRARRAR